jgi:hypothetical protein
MFLCLCLCRTCEPGLSLRVYFSRCSLYIYISVQDVLTSHRTVHTLVAILDLHWDHFIPELKVNLYMKVPGHLISATKDIADNYVFQIPKTIPLVVFTIIINYLKSYFPGFS